MLIFFSFQKSTKQNIFRINNEEFILNKNRCLSFKIFIYIPYLKLYIKINKQELNKKSEYDVGKKLLK